MSIKEGGFRRPHQNEVVVIANRGIKIYVCYNLYFVDGIQDVIVPSDSIRIKDKLILNVYLPFNISLASAKSALNRLKEDLNASSSEV